jgi:hypothetical protein
MRAVVIGAVALTFTALAAVVARPAADAGCTRNWWPQSRQNASD